MRGTTERETKERAFRFPFENAQLWPLLIGLGLVLTACGTPPPTDRPAVRFTEARPPGGGEDFKNWPLAPDVIETEVARALRVMRIEPVSSQRTATGISGAAKIALLFLERFQSSRLQPAPPPGHPQHRSSGNGIGWTGGGAGWSRLGES